MSVEPPVTLSAGGVTVVLLSNGASIRELHMPDRSGVSEDVVLGHPQPKDYLEDSRHGAYLGCVVGRVANRIRNATFTVPLTSADAQTMPESAATDSSGQQVTLEANDGPHALHGGPKHWGRQEWLVVLELHTADVAEVTFSRKSPDGEAGYPGEVSASVTYSLRPAAGQQVGEQHLATLTVTFEALSTKLTPINMVQHTHWNLAGAARVAKGATVHGHALCVHGAFSTPVDSESVPTGAIEAVAGTALDFLESAPVGKALQELPDGVDHNFVLHTEQQDLRSLATEPGGMLADEARPAAELYEPESGRCVRLRTNAPGVQVYTGNFLDGVPGKGGVKHAKQQSVCLETQTYPNSVNEEAFPGPWLQPGEQYKHVMVYELLCKPA